MKDKTSPTSTPWLGVGAVGSAAACAACCAAPAVLVGLGAAGLAASVSAALVWLEPTLLVLTGLLVAALLYRRHARRRDEMADGSISQSCTTSCEISGEATERGRGCGCISD